MKKVDKLEDYDGFVEKFKPKKTTDDCYTPPDVYETVRQYVFDYYKLDKDTEVVRPFYPGGDYQSVNYSENSVVIDNPPFSILKEIKDYFCKNDIKFFLFAPHLTLFSGRDDESICYIVTDSGITYENGAIVSTSFVTNLDDCRIRIDPDLKDELANCKKYKTIVKKKYPYNVISPGLLSKYIVTNQEVKFYKEDLHFISRLDSQRNEKKAIYGCGFLISDKKANELKALKELKELKELEELEELKKTKEEYVWALSEREQDIIDSLSS